MVRSRTVDGAVSDMSIGFGLEVSAMADGWREHVEALSTSRTARSSSGQTSIEKASGVLNGIGNRQAVQQLNGNSNPNRDDKGKGRNSGSKSAKPSLLASRARNITSQ